MKNRQWLLARRPEGAIQDSDFKLVETDVPTPGEGQVVVRNLMLSCDPTQRGWIGRDTYLPAVKIGEVVRSLGAGDFTKCSHDASFTRKTQPGAEWLAFTKTKHQELTGATVFPRGEADCATASTGPHGCSPVERSARQDPVPTEKE